MDGFSHLFLPPSNYDPSMSINLTNRSAWSTHIARVIVKALGEVKVEKPCLFIDGLDFILAAGEDQITAIEILTLLSCISEVLLITL